MNTSDYESIFDYRGQSYNSACAKYPFARYQERQALIELLTLNSSQKIIDAPAGGGYLADGIREQTGGDVQITCIEPASNFSQAIRNNFRVINAQIDNIPLPDNSIDVVASLAGLHHIPDRQGVFSEWARLLKSGGQLAVADVAAGSGPDEFLNDFVHRHTPRGHEGIFIGDSEFNDLLLKNQLTPHSDRVTVVPWVFDSHEDIAEFCIQLFYLPEVSTHTVLDYLDKVIGIQCFEDNKVGINWELRYALGIKD